jgi:hypothetical protein
MRSGTTPVLAALAVTLAACGERGGDAPEKRTPAPPPPASDPLAEGGPPVTPITPIEPSEAAQAGEGTLLAALGWNVPVPAGWTQEQPSSSMRAAQYNIPGDAGDAELVVFRGIRGGVDPNINRWIGQVSDPTMAPVRQTLDLADGRRVHTVEMIGTYQVGQMMGGSGQPQADTRFVGLVLEGGPEGLVFIRVVGPNATLEPQRDRIEQMIRGVGPS